MYDIKIKDKKTGETLISISGVADPKRALKAYLFEGVEVETIVSKFEPKKLTLWQKIKKYLKSWL